jgi:hypothetical protein
VSVFTGLVTLSAGHAFAQPPQFCTSEDSLTHPLGHDVKPLEHPHEPLVQTSLFPQDLPSLAVGLEQVPVGALQVPALWHASDAVHEAVEQQTLLTQLPVAHCVPPLHECPRGAVLEHEPELQ